MAITLKFFTLTYLILATSLKADAREVTLLYTNDIYSAMGY